MDLIKRIQNKSATVNYKEMIIKSLKVGLFAFVVSFFLSLGISLLINVLFLNYVNEIVQGAIGTSDQLTLSGIMKTASFIMNVSVFNRLDQLKFGILIFAVIPFLSFYFADRKDNRSEGISIEHIYVYTSAGFVYALLSMLEAYLSKGELVGVTIDFFSVGNFFSTLIMAFAIQLIIGLNYDSHGLTGVRATKRLFWILLSVGAFVSVGGMLYLLKDFAVPFLYKIGAILMLLPNLAVYALFSFMGTSVGLGESLVSALQLAEMDLSFSALPPVVKILALLIFVSGIAIALFGLNKDAYLKHLTVFAISFSAVTFFSAYATTIDLGTVVVLEDVFIGVSLVQAFLLPLGTIMALGMLLKLIRDVVIVFKAD